MASRALRILAAVAAMVWSAAVRAEPVAVRFPEANTYGVLSLRAPAGEALAHGELVQVVKGERVESRLTFRFKDGSRSDETVVFTQRGVFRLLSYRLSQRGRSFPQSMDVSLERESGRYQVRVRDKPDDAEKVNEGRLDLPADLYNGMLAVVLKNVPRDGKGTGHMVAFTPEPRLLKMELLPVAEDSFLVGDLSRVAVRFLVKLELGGLTGMAATLLGKQPPRLYYWIAAQPIPAFLKFEGPMYATGPVWRIELTGPRFPE